MFLKVIRKNFIIVFFGEKLLVSIVVMVKLKVMSFEVLFNSDFFLRICVIFEGSGELVVIVDIVIGLVGDRIVVRVNFVVMVIVGIS